MGRLSLLQIALTTKCQLSCHHCPMAQYRNTTQKYPLKCQELIKFLGAYCKPDKWVIELTGGEPALFEDIDHLCEWLSGNGYRTVIKTNGLTEIKSRPGITRVAAFHQLDNPPKYFDEILIIDKLDREAKERVCKQNGWPYKVIGFNKEVIDDLRNEFQFIAFINPAGHQLGCPAVPAVENDIGTDDLNRINHRPLVAQYCCPTCKLANDVWRFII